MKKSLILAAAAIAALSACTKEIEVTPINDSKAPVFTATIEPKTKTQLVEGSTAGKLTKVEWLNTDEVSVNGTVYTVAPGSDATTATLTKKNSTDASPEPTFKAYYPASLYNEGTATLPASYTYAEGKFNMPMYAENTETTLGFKNICAVLAITVPNSQMSSVTSITVSSDKQMNGAFTATSAGVLTFAEKTLEDADKKVTLTFSAAKAIATSETFYIAIPANTYAYLQIDVTDGTNTYNMRTKAASITVERNKIYPFTFKSNLLAGVFTVSAGADGVAGTADDKKVKFTKANLYWDGSAYQFEANQYDKPVLANYTSDGTGGTWLDTHVGHFFWARTANEAYIQTYGENNRGTTDKLFCGKDNKLTVSGTSDLYVLSAEEWHYLTGLYNDFGYSGNRSDAYRFANARVNGVAGLLIFPDGYNGTVSGDGIAEVNKDDVQNENYPSASIPDATWSAMEAAGVVFLPAAGCRSGQTIDNCGKNGFYWSSTLIDKDNSYMLFDMFGIVDCPKNQKREKGCSIRLVKTVE